ncbi:sigma-70 family RNA polymerase sigma factor [Cellvibrio sp.]|jgi:RNA polymerase sigma factor (sigma-70 family)
MDPNHDFLHLLSATAQGDRLAFADLYRQTAGKLYAISLQMLRRRDLAEEAVQEAFVRIWHNAGDYQQEKGTVLTWMISIVRYRALDMLRATKSRRETGDEGLEEALDEQSPEQELYEQRDRVRIDRCMDRLDEGSRQAIEMAYFRGLTHMEVCDQMETPLGTIKTWIRRGLERLKRCLES